MSDADEPKSPSSACSQLPSIMSSMGLDYYLNPDLPGFRGTLKMFPEDFVVTEVDTDGKLVTLDLHSDLPPKPPAPLLPSEEETEKLAKGSRPIASEVPPLEQLVEPELYQSVKELAESYRTSLDPHPRNNVFLGSFSDRETRAHIHVALRLACPLLETRTSRDKEGVSQIYVVPDPKFVRLHEVLGTIEAERLLSFLNTAEKTAKSIHFLPLDDSKDHRSKIHQVLNELYGYLVTTRTYTAEHGSRRKKFKLDPKQQGHSSDRSSTQSGDFSTPQIAVKFRVTPSYRKKHSPDNTTVKFVLYKRNTDCLYAIQQLCDVLGCQPSQFAYSGTKDKRALTTQHMTVRGVTPERLRSANSKLTNVQTGNYEYTDTHVQLGDHSGNHFTIELRALQPNEGNSENVKNVVPIAVESLKRTGFVNYFGPQRFGWSLHSSRIGLAMLQKNYKAAVDTILEVQDDSKPSAIVDAKRYYFSTDDITGTLEQIPSFCTEEIYVLKALQRHGLSKQGYTNAVMSIPFHFRKMYLNSVSSLVWNHLATFRMQEYGSLPVEGDLVISDEDWASQQPVVNAKRDCVHVLTSTDIQTGRYSIREVVLPLIGTASVFPKNRVADRLKELLLAAGITLASFRLGGLQMHLAGAYRKLIAQPKHLTWKWADPRKVSSFPFLPSSVNRPTGTTERTGTTSIHANDRESKGSVIHVADKGTAVGTPVLKCANEDKTCKPVEEYPNLEISFTLEKSCYATVLLRELMKQI